MYIYCTKFTKSMFSELGDCFRLMKPLMYLLKWEGNKPTQDLLIHHVKIFQRRGSVISEMCQTFDTVVQRTKPLGRPEKIEPSKQIDVMAHHSLPDCLCCPLSLLGGFACQDSSPAGFQLDGCKTQGEVTSATQKNSLKEALVPFSRH